MAFAAHKRGRQASGTVQRTAAPPTQRRPQRPRSVDAVLLTLDRGSVAATPCPTPGPRAEAPPDPTSVPPFVPPPPHRFPSLLAHRGPQPPPDGICTGCHASLLAVHGHCAHRAPLAAPDFEPPNLDAPVPPSFSPPLADPTKEVPLMTPEETNDKEAWMLARQRDSEAREKAEAARMQGLHAPGIGGAADPAKGGSLYRTILARREGELSALRTELAGRAAELREERRRLQGLRERLAACISGYRDAGERYGDEVAAFIRGFGAVRDAWEAWLGALAAGEWDAREAKAQIQALESEADQRRVCLKDVTAKLEEAVLQRIQSEEHLAELRADNTRLQRRADEATRVATTRLGETVHELAALREKKRQLAAAKDAADAREKDLRSQLGSLDAATGALEQEVADLEQECLALSKKRAELSSAKIAGDEELAALERESSNLRRELESAQQAFSRDREALQERVRNLTKLADEAKKELAALEYESPKIAQENEAAQQTADRHRFARTTAENHIQDARQLRDRDLVHHQGLVFTLQEAISAAQAQVDAGQPAAAALRSQNKSLKATVEGLDREVRTLQGDLQAIKTASTEAGNAARKAADASAEARKRVVEDIENVWKKKAADAEKSARAAEDALRSRTKELGAQRQQQLDRIEKLRVEEKAQAAELEASRRRVEDAVTEVAAITGTCGALRQAVDAVKGDIEQAKEEKRKLETSNEEAEQENRRLAVELAGLQADLRARSDDVAAASADLDQTLLSAQSGCAGLESDLVGLHQRLKWATEDNSDARTSLDAAMRDKSEAQAALSEMQRRLREVRSHLTSRIRDRRQFQQALVEAQRDVMFYRDRAMHLTSLDLDDALPAQPDGRIGRSQASEGLLNELDDLLRRARGDLGTLMSSAPRRSTGP